MTLGEPNTWTMGEGGGVGMCTGPPSNIGIHQFQCMCTVLRAKGRQRWREENLRTGPKLRTTPTIRTPWEFPRRKIRTILVSHKQFGLPPNHSKPPQTTSKNKNPTATASNRAKDKDPFFFLGGG